MPISPIMIGARSSLAGCALLVGLLAAMATAAPSRSPLSAARQRTPLAVSAQASLAADTQLVSALRAHIAAARQRERATLAAIDQRLRAIYAVPGEPPLVALLTGNAAQAQALVELASAMTESDDALLSSYTAALTNLQIAQSSSPRTSCASTPGCGSQVPNGRQRAFVPTASTARWCRRRPRPCLRRRPTRPAACPRRSSHSTPSRDRPREPGDGARNRRARVAALPRTM